MKRALRSEANAWEVLKTQWVWQFQQETGLVGAVFWGRLRAWGLQVVCRRGGQGESR
jgi:hypothetical protein